MLADVEMTTPVFKPTEVAKVFFARSSHWIRWLERDGRLRYFDELVGTRSKSGARSYSLFDVERMARGLARNGVIDERQLAGALQVVRAMAAIYGYLPPVPVPA